MTSFECLSTELILRILGQLKDVRDLVQFRQVNKRMYRLGHDSILWKELFIDTFLASSSTKFNDDEGVQASKRARKTAHDEAGLQNLPARVLKSLPSVEDDKNKRIDWHSLYRISWNWRKGYFDVHQLDAAMKVAQTPSFDRFNNPTSKLDLPNTIIESKDEYIFTAMRGSTYSQIGSPEVSVFPVSFLKKNMEAKEEEFQQVATFLSPSLPTQDQTNVSAIAIDREDAGTDLFRLLTAYKNGLLSISSFSPSTKTFREIVSYQQKQQSAIVTAAFSWPFITTCTIDFRIRIYCLNEKADSTINFRLIAERKSYSCHWPACLRLDPAKQNKDAFRLSIVYSNPIYPSGWSIGLQEIYLDHSGVVDSRSASAKRSYVVTEPFSSNTLTHTTIIDQIGRLTSLSYEEPFVVVGSRDNGVFCFRVDEVKDDSDHHSKALSIRYLTTLHGHTGSVYSVSLNGGRCVTGGSDGKVQVWYLGDEEVSIARATGVMLKGRIRNKMGKFTSLRLSDARSEKKRGQKRKLSDITDDENSKSNSKPLTLADIRKYHIYSSTNSTFTSQPPIHVIRWLTSAFDRIISITSNKRNLYESRDNSAANIPSSCRIEAHHEGQNEEESVQIWNFAA